MCETSVQRWNVFFEHCLFRGQYQQVWTWMHYILKTPPLSPSRKTFYLFFQAVFFLDSTKPPPFRVIRKYIESMKRHDVAFGDEILQVLVEGYNRMDAKDEARQVKELYLSARVGQGVLVNPEACNEQLATLVAAGEDDKAERELKRMLSSGFAPTPKTLDAFAEHIRNSDALLHWESALNVTASRSAWSSVLRNSAEENTAGATLAAYRTMLERRHVPSPSDIFSVLEALCNNRVSPPTDDEIHRAVKLFDEYVSITSSDATRNPQDDFPSYDILLRTICNSRKSTLYSVAVRLLEEMRRLGIVEDRQGSQSLDDGLIRFAPNASAAYKVYKLLYKSQDGAPSLDATGFETVLGIFLTVHPNHESLTPIYLEIVSDMQHAGYPSTPAVYTRLLRILRNVLPSPEEDLIARGALASSIVQVHNAISIDATLAPDTTLWNALMDAYQHALCFSEAFRVWEMLFVSQRFDPASVDVVLGACARGGFGARAKDTVVRLHKLGYPFDQQNWTSWVACLCGLGQLEEATNVLCVAMVQEAEQGKDVRPTKGIAEVILKAAAEKGELEEIRGRIHASIPDLKVDEIAVGDSAS
ncbi:hypothetical protein PsYK624_018950 [Phanerochaete sordida]|uniref:Pentacotripeptide-repeat region of PRORP domain-containing protein n=1 Tax=Phanerochaete sordida TaxID=48140 RepID=A0A9P3G079_9APHY|nr:hypothetical protein PsYK624_018950 [Phanerochaete sordida]